MTARPTERKRKPPRKPELPLNKRPEAYALVAVLEQAVLDLRHGVRPVWLVREDLQRALEER